MWLREIEADRLRNLRAVSVGLASGLTVVSGRNGQGKTSLLESIYLLATSRSFRTRRLDETQSWDGGPLRVAGPVSWRAGDVRLTVVMDGAERSLLVDGVPGDLESYLGRLDLVDLTGERMKVLKGSPDERRRFLDRGIVGLTPSFLRVLGTYRKVLQQRNALLRSLARAGPGSRLQELRAWDSRLVEAGSRVHQRRREYAATLSTRLGEPGRILFPGGEEVLIRYRGSPAVAMDGDPDRFAEVFAEALDDGRERDLGMGFTGSGPHRDDLVAELDGVDLRRYGSAGQIRAALVALKLAKLRLLQDEHGEAPLFLMDDFDTDLDETRARNLAGFLHEGGFQAIVATSKDSLADDLGVPFRRIRMVGGEAAEA